MPSVFKTKRLPFLFPRFSSKASSADCFTTSSSISLPTLRLAREGAGVAFAAGYFQQPGVAEDVVTVVEVVPVILQPVMVEHDVVVKVVVVLPAVLTP